MTLVAHATEGSINTGEFWTDGAAEARMESLYALVWSAVAVGLVIVEWRGWRRYAPKEVRVEPVPARDRAGG
jgi:uncharacterized protein